MVVVSLNEAQTRIINEMVPAYGENDSEVIKTIVTMFLHQNCNKIEDVLYWTEEDH